MKTKNISSGLEDYLEAIYIADINKTQLKGAELARSLNISRASVSEALSKLASKNLIRYESYGEIALTDKGRLEAKEVYNKHNILKNFFEVVFNIPSDEAEENGCKIEHIISQNILDKMLLCTEYYKKHPELVEQIFGRAL